MKTLFQKIPAYFENKLSEAEEIAFEKAIETNTELAKKVEAYRQKLMVIDMLENEQAMQAIDYDTSIEVTPEELEKAKVHIKTLVKNTSLSPLFEPSKNYYFLWLSITVSFLLITFSIVKWCSSPSANVTDRQGKHENTTQEAREKLTFAQDTTKKTAVAQQKNLPTPPSKQETKKDTSLKKNLPTQTEEQKELNTPQNEGMRKEMEGAAEGRTIGKKVKFKVLSPKNYTLFTQKVIFEWENEKRIGNYKITIYNRYGREIEKKTIDVQANEPLVRFEMDITDLEPAFYFWKLQHKDEEQPFTGGFIAK